MADRLRPYTSSSAFPNPQRVRPLALEKGIAAWIGEVGPTETPLDERFEQIDRSWRNWKSREIFRPGTADRGGLPELAR